MIESAPDKIAERMRGYITVVLNIGFELVMRIHYPVDTPRVLPYHPITV